MPPSSLYRFFLYGKAIQASLHNRFLDHFSGYPLFLLPLIAYNPSFFLSCPTLKELGIYRPAKGREAGWLQCGQKMPMGREGRPEDKAVLTWKRRCRKERGRTGITHKHKGKSPRVPAPLPHLSNSSADGLGVEVKGTQSSREGLGGKR